MPGGVRSRGSSRSISSTSATADIARGNVSGVIDKINDVLSQLVPLLIGFLASVIGLGGVGQKGQGDHLGVRAGQAHPRTEPLT